MIPSGEFMTDAHAVCVEKLDKMSSTLRRVIRQRVVCDDPEITEFAMTAYRNALVERALHNFLFAIERLPDLPRHSAMSILDGFIGGLEGLLDEVADEAIHPTIDKLN